MTFALDTPIFVHRKANNLKCYPPRLNFVILSYIYDDSEVPVSARASSLVKPTAYVTIRVLGILFHQDQYHHDR